MTRKSRREIERSVDDLETHASGVGEDRPTREVYRDPVTGRCYDGWGPDADPVEELPEDVDLFVITRALSMTRGEARRNAREVIDVIDERDRGENTVVSVRVDPAPDVDAEAAVRLPDPAPGPTIDFTEADT